MNTQEQSSGITPDQNPADAAPLSNEALQKKLLEEGDTQARLELAQSSGLSEAVQSKLLQDEEEAVLIALASNPSLLESAQEKLAETGTPDVRTALAANPSLNENHQHYLAQTGSDEVKCQLAKNPSLSVAIQRMFATDATRGVREALAENASLDKACQPVLMQDSDAYSQHIVWTLIPLASNPALAPELHERLAANDDNCVVASLAQNPALSDALMKKFAASDVEEIKAGLACNPSLPEALQARLIAGDNTRVSVNIAKNTALKIAQQAQLAHGGNAEVRLALLDNPSLDERIRQRVKTSFTEYDLSSAERDLEYAQKQSAKLTEDYSEALKKCINSYGGLFPASEEKQEKLSRTADRIQKRIFEVDREIDALETKCRKIEALLKQHPETARPGKTWPFPMSNVISQFARLG